MKEKKNKKQAKAAAAIMPQKDAFIEIKLEFIDEIAH